MLTASYSQWSFNHNEIHLFNKPLKNVMVLPSRFTKQVTRREKHRIRNRLHPASWRWALSPTAVPGEDVFPPNRYYYITTNIPHPPPLDLRTPRYFRKLRRAPYRLPNPTQPRLEVDEGGSLMYTTNILGRSQYATHSSVRSMTLWQNRDRAHPQFPGIIIHDEEYHF